jgi:MtN3 and saliva related transmembrane protein
MEYKELIGFAAAATTTLGFLPKIISVVHKRSAKDVPWWLIAIFALDVVLWFAYGFLLESLPTMVASALIGIFILLLATAKAAWN